MRHVHHPDLAWEEIHSPTRKFHSFFKNISLALGGTRNVGPWGGGHPFDLQLRRIPPGASVCPFHAHLAQWELFVVQAGRGDVRTTEGLHPVQSGDVFIHPPGAAHQLLNRSSSEELEVLIVTDNPPVDGCHYPDSDKWALRPPGKVFRMNAADYFDGEDPAPAGAAPYAISTPASSPVAPFAQRRLHLDDLAWEPFDSPRKKFRGESKELSIALGARRNTPVGLGGHPFDLELGRLPPGFAGCPFHFHAAQSELFLILSGTAIVRANDETETLRAGDVVFHPPGEAHQIINASSTEPLLYYLVADNPPVDYWYYPDSRKWGLREPRMFFRPAPLEYWDGEE